MFVEAIDFFCSPLRRGLRVIAAIGEFRGGAIASLRKVTREGMKFEEYIYGSTLNNSMLSLSAHEPQSKCWQVHGEFQGSRRDRLVLRVMLRLLQPDVVYGHPIVKQPGELSFRLVIDIPIEYQNYLRSRRNSDE